MNLTKYFNKNYLKENIKKSKGLIALLVIVVPLITTLSILFLSRSENYTKLLDIGEMIWPNLICMYIIPVVLSLVLFGYVYKKSSVDFINSMPLNRKTIFITNTVAGILLITVIQVLTLIAIFLCNSLCSTVTVFPQMLIDIFISMWVSYLFMFLTTNLAMTLSGTFLTQVVLTMLILFLVPFTESMFNYNQTTVFDYEMVNKSGDDTTFANIISSKNKNYTMPYNIIWNAGDGMYSNESILKMAVLGIVYLALGTYFFQKRKMENAEESFSNDKVHLLVKALTIFPMIVVLNRMGVSGAENIFVISLIVIYYFVYDFIVKRKIKFIKSVVALVVTLVVLQGIVAGADKVFIPKDNINKVKRSDVAKISIEFENYYYYYGSTLDLKDSYFIDNREIVDFVFEAAFGAQNPYTYGIDNEVYGLQTIYIGIETDNNKKYTISVELVDKDIDKLLNLLEKEDKYVESLKDSYKINSKILLGNAVLVEDEKKIKNEIENAIDNMSLKEIFDMTKSPTNIYLRKMYYQDHLVKSKVIPVDTNNQILKLVADNQNNYVNKNFNKLMDENTRVRNYSVEYGNLGYDEEDYKKFRNYFEYTSNLIDKFIEENKDEKIDPNEKCYAIRIYAYPYFEENSYLFTNKTDEIDEIIKKEKSLKSGDKTITFKDSELKD